MSTASPHVPPPPMPEPCGVYLDNTALVDLADATELRNPQAMQLLALFQKYQTSGLLWVASSLWAVTECHGILYRKELERLGTPVPFRGGRERPLRDTVPPVLPALGVATNQVNTLINTLQTTTAFLILPDTNKDSTPLFKLTVRFAEEAGLWAPDSVHASIAMESGDCQILVTDDGDFLDKIDSCQATFITPYRQNQFSELTAPPPFNAYGILPTVSELPTHHARQSAMQALNVLGFN